MAGEKMLVVPVERFHHSLFIILSARINNLSFHYDDTRLYYSCGISDNNTVRRYIFRNNSPSPYDA